MSRICGIVGSGWPQERIKDALARLISPLCHSTDFQVELVNHENCGLARIFFRSYNFSTHLHSNEEMSVTCAFSGYLFEPGKLAEKLERHERGELKTLNPAFLFSKLYPRFGPQLLRDLSGSFVFALWESESATLTIGADRFGVIPLYYRRLSNGFAFASEIKSLAHLEPGSGTHYLALSELFTLGSPIGDHTLFNSVSRLAPAAVMTVNSGKITVEKFWSFADLPAGPAPSVPEFVEESRRLLGRSVAKLVEQIEKPVCFLSAGYDSRRILFELTEHQKQVVAYTAPTVTQKDSPITVDVPVASALCRALGVTHVASALPPTNWYGRLYRHTQTLLDYETDSHPWILPLLRDLPVAEGVNFDGLGGDVLFEFNWTYPHLAGITGDPAALALAVEERYPDIWRQCLSAPTPIPSLRDRYRDHYSALPNFADRITTFFFTNWARRKTALFAQGLLSLKIDSVFPFLDYDLVDFVLRLPPLVRRESEVSKLMLKQAHPEIMSRIPTSHDPELFRVDGGRWSAFQTPLPSHYWLKMQASIHRAAARDILRAPGLLAKMTNPARISTLANLMPIPSDMTPSKITARSWRLSLLGLSARQYRASNSPRVAVKNLTEARRFLFSDRDPLR